MEQSVLLQQFPDAVGRNVSRAARQLGQLRPDMVMKPWRPTLSRIRLAIGGEVGIVVRIHSVSPGFVDRIGRDHRADGTGDQDCRPALLVGAVAPDSHARQKI